MLVVSCLPVTAAAADVTEPALEVAYKVNFNGDATFAPAGILGASENFTYTPSADGSALTIKGNDYGGSPLANKEGPVFWGAKLNGITVNADSRYTMIFKANNLSNMNSSQIAVGGWYTGTREDSYGTVPCYWNITSSFNSTNTSVFNLMHGNNNGIAADVMAGGKDAQKAADKDADGFMTVKIEYDGGAKTMKVYTLKGGAWTLMASRDITVSDENALCLMIYSYRSGTIYATVKDVVFYKGIEGIDPAYTAPAEPEKPAEPTTPAAPPVVVTPPKTGDNTTLILGVMVLAAAACIIVSKKRIPA